MQPLLQNSRFHVTTVTLLCKSHVTVTLRALWNLFLCHYATAICRPHFPKTQSLTVLCIYLFCIVSQSPRYLYTARYDKQMQICHSEPQSLRHDYYAVQACSFLKGTRTHRTPTHIDPEIGLKSNHDHYSCGDLIWSWACMSSSLH